MTIKLGNLTRWNKLDPSKVLVFGEENRAQRLRIEFNVSAPTKITAIDHHGGERFVGRFVGNETVEFTVHGPVELYPTMDDPDGEVWWYSRDGDTEAVQLVHEVPFTRVMMRRSRNPELELMMFKMNQNIERRVAAEIASHMTAVKAAGVPHNPETGEVEDQDDDENSAGDAEDIDGVQPATEVDPKSPAK